MADKTEPPSKAEEKKPADPVDDVPDPDEDDLDDLDDMLEDFSTVRLDAKKAPEAAGPGRPAPPGKDEVAAPDFEPSVEDVLNDEEFTKQLQAGMADLLGELEKSPEMQAQFEDMFKQLGAAAAAAKEPGTAAEAEEAAAAAADEASFQETIRRTMERMQTSGDQATAAATAEGSDDLLAEMMRQFGAGGAAGPDGAGSDEDFSKMLVGMMEQLTAKDILYEPMKELDDKFPTWMSQNKATLSKEDATRYEEQQGYVRKIVAKFEEPTFADTNPKDREYIVDLMQKMQALGAPPPDLVGDMSTAQEAFNAPEESCNPQ